MALRRDLEDYVAGAPRVGEDGKSVSFPLKGRFSLAHFTIGPKVVLDLRAAAEAQEARASEAQRAKAPEPQKKAPASGTATKPEAEARLANPALKRIAEKAAAGSAAQPQATAQPDPTPHRLRSIRSTRFFRRRLPA